MSSSTPILFVIQIKKCDIFIQNNQKKNKMSWLLIVRLWTENRLMLFKPQRSNDSSHRMLSPTHSIHSKYSIDISFNVRIGHLLWAKCTLKKKLWIINLTKKFSYFVWQKTYVTFVFFNSTTKMELLENHWKLRASKLLNIRRIWINVAQRA